jgi:hypothetical protein
MAPLTCETASAAATINFPYSLYCYGLRSHRADISGGSALAIAHYDVDSEARRIGPLNAPQSSLLFAQYSEIVLGMLVQILSLDDVALGARFASKRDVPVVVPPSITASPARYV